MTYTQPVHVTHDSKPTFRLPDSCCDTLLELRITGGSPITEAVLHHDRDCKVWGGEVLNTPGERRRSTQALRTSLLALANYLQASPQEVAWWTTRFAGVTAEASPVLPELLAYVHFNGDVS